MTGGCITIMDGYNIDGVAADAYFFGYRRHQNETLIQYDWFECDEEASARERADAIGLGDAEFHNRMRFYAFVTDRWTPIECDTNIRIHLDDGRVFYYLHLKP